MEWYNKRHIEGLALQRSNLVWAPNPVEHLEKTKEKARNHDVECFDHDTGKYEVTVWGGTTNDGASLALKVLRCCTC